MKANITFKQRAAILLLAVLCSFTGAWAQKALPYEYAFEKSLATDGWTATITSDYAGISNAAAHSGSYGFAFNYEESSDVYLVSPVLTGGTNGVDVSFYYMAYSSSWLDHFKVGYTTDVNADPSEFTYGELITSSNSWTLYENTFPAGTVRIAIKYDTDNYDDGFYLFLDDFSFTAFSGVMKPANLTATEVGTTSANVNWEGSHDSYVLQYRTAAQATPLSAWHQVGSDKVATGTLTTYTFDLSGYTGTGAIAIRHYNVSDMFKLVVDDIVVTNAGGEEVLREGFESGSIPSEWTNLDYDGDGYRWVKASFTGEGVQNGSYCVYSESWVSGIGAVTPDNWLIIPNVELGGTLTFVARGTDANYPDENFGVFVTQESYAAVDAGEWSTDIETTEKTYQLTGLSANTPYDWRVKGIVGTKESDWATSTFNTISEGFKTFVTDGNWNVAENWFPAGIPTASDEVTIDAKVTIPSGVIAVAKRASVGTGSITIEDGGQLKQASATLVVTVKKSITAGKKSFIATPLGGTTYIGNNAGWNHVLNLDKGNFDIYAFESTAANAEWDYYSTSDYLVYGEGYFYANDADQTAEFTGSAMASANNSITKDVTYNGSSTNPYNGWRLIGNPYTCTGYVTYSENATFYKLNAAGDGYDVYENGLELAPGEGGFVKVAASGTITYSSENPGVTISKTGTATAPYLPALGLAVDQGASNPNIVLANASSNATTLTTYNEETVNVILNGRTLVQNDSWNTLCLPFNLTIAGSPLDGATVKVLDKTATTFASNKLSVKFTDAPATITAGTPFIVKWASGSNISNPVFNNVIINNVASPEVSFTGGKFVGTFSPTTLTGNDMSLLYFGAANKLYWPSANVTLNSFRAYFDLDDISSTAPNIVVDFGDGATGIEEAVKSEEIRDKSYYNLNGQKVERPTSKGVYIVNGRKVVLH